MAITNEYVLGYGKVSIGVIRNVSTNKMALTIGDLVSNHQVKEDLKGKEGVYEKNITLIRIDNLEGLDVLEKACKAIRKTFKDKK